MEQIVDEPAFKKFDQDLLIRYLLDNLITEISTDKNNYKNDLNDQINNLLSLNFTSKFFAAA